MLIHDKFHCEGNDSFDKFSNITDMLGKRQNVEFALYCAKDVFHLVNDQDKEVAKLCLDLIKKWLTDEESVTRDELRIDAYFTQSNAANAAWAAAYATAWAAADAAADWVAGTSRAAAYTACTAVNANSNSNKLNEYLIIANSHLTKTNINCPNYEIEGKILYLIDELEENIIINKDKYYVNMNGIEKCPEYGFNTQQELLNELFNSKCLFWVFVRNWLDRLYKEEK